MPKLPDPRGAKLLSVEDRRHLIRLLAEDTGALASLGDELGVDPVPIVLGELAAETMAQGLAAVELEDRVGILEAGMLALGGFLRGVVGADPEPERVQTDDEREIADGFARLGARVRATVERTEAFWRGPDDEASHDGGKIVGGEEGTS